MEELIATTVKNRVATLRINLPRRLNGWTMPLKDALFTAMDVAVSNDDVAVVVLTGTGEYYSAGVDLSGSLELGHPRVLRRMIVEQNRALFELFIQFPKPILVAVNGHAIGAPVTSATLCDAILAAEHATFSTPFAKVGLPAEGCSSVHLPRLVGRDAAERMLGPEGWKPTAAEAFEIGLVNEVVRGEQLLDRAQALGELWVAENKSREYRAGATRGELEYVNAEESERVADAFLSSEFLMGQYRFLKSRKKTLPALTFLALRVTRPAWSLLL